MLILAALVGLVAAACGGASGPHASRTPARQTPQPGSTPSGHLAAWTYDDLMRRLRGRRLRVGGQTVRIDPDTVTCGGLGPPVRRVGGAPVWSRFRCVQPTFPPGAVAGPDAIFIVEPTGRDGLAIVGSRLTRY